MSQSPIIRPAQPADAAAIAAIYAPYCASSAISFEEVAPGADGMRERIVRIGAGRPWIVLEVDGTLVGYAYAGLHNERAAYRWSVSTAIYVSAAHHGRGAGRALYTTLLDLVRRLGYYQATAGITLPNPASIGLHQALGFSLVGVYRNIGYKFGTWHDVGWYQAELRRPSPAPAPPRSIETLYGSAEWSSAIAQGLERYVGHSR